jgi:hypothetical protein
MPIHRSSSPFEYGGNDPQDKYHKTDVKSVSRSEGAKGCFHPYRNTADVGQPTFLRGVDLLLSSLLSALSQSLETNGLT